MKIVKIDIEQELPAGEFLDGFRSTQEKTIASKAIINQAREKADQEARLVGGRVRVDMKPEFYIRRGSHVLLGGDLMLVASRWSVEVPDSFDPHTAASASR